MADEYHAYVDQALSQADEHPDLEPAAIGALVAKDMEAVQLRAFASSMLAYYVVDHRRRLAREAENRAAELAAQKAREDAAEYRKQQQERIREAEKSARESVRNLSKDLDSGDRERVEQARQWMEQAQQDHRFPELRQSVWDLYHQRLILRQAQEEKDRREKAASQVFFSELYEDPAQGLRWLHENFPRTEDARYFTADNFKEWCSDEKFSDWFGRADRLVRDAAEEQSAKRKENWLASRFCVRHNRHECTGRNKQGPCHRPSTVNGLCGKHGGELLVNLNQRWTSLDSWWLDEVFYPGGAMKRAIDKLVSEVAEQTRLEITEELLGTKFALGDGTMVTWGEATVTQHRQRIRMLSKNAAGIVETASRHEAAVRMCEEAGVDRLEQVGGAL